MVSEWGAVGIWVLVSGTAALVLNLAGAKKQPPPPVPRIPKKRRVSHLLDSLDV